MWRYVLAVATIFLYYVSILEDGPMSLEGLIYLSSGEGELLQRWPDVYHRASFKCAAFGSSQHCGKGRVENRSECTRCVTAMEVHS